MDVSGASRKASRPEIVACRHRGMNRYEIHSRLARAARYATLTLDHLPGLETICS